MEELLTTLVTFWTDLPIELSSVILLFGGLLGAFFARLVVTTLLVLLHFDQFGEKTGLGEFLRKGGVTYTASKLVGVAVFWACLIAVLLFLSWQLDIRVVTSFVERIESILPSVMAAALIVVLGLVVVGFVSNFTRTILRNAGSSNAELIAKIVRSVGLGLFLLIALEELGIGKTIINGLVIIFAATVGLAAALAFGLGCKDLARDWLQRTLSDWREKRRLEGKRDLEG